MILTHKFIKQLIQEEPSSNNELLQNNKFETPNKIFEKFPKRLVKIRGTISTVPSVKNLKTP